MGNAGLIFVRSHLLVQLISSDISNQPNGIVIITGARSSPPPVIMQVRCVCSCLCGTGDVNHCPSVGPSIWLQVGVSVGKVHKCIMVFAYLCKVLFEFGQFRNNGVWRRRKETCFTKKYVDTWRWSLLTQIFYGHWLAYEQTIFPICTIIRCKY